MMVPFGLAALAVIVDFEDAKFEDWTGPGINDLVSTVHRGLSETTSVLSALADADLTQTMNGHFQGAFAELQGNVNVEWDVAQVDGLHDPPAFAQHTDEVLAEQRSARDADRPA